MEGDTLWIETIRQSVCSRCSAQKACGHGLLNQLRGGHQNYLRVSRAQFPATRFSLDDEVRIGIPEQLLLQGAFTLYLLPLLGMLLAAAASTVIWPAAGDGASAGSAAAGLLLGLLLLRCQARRLPAMQPRLLGRAVPAAL